MPRGRDFTSLALQAPGAANERKLAGISVDGASGAENRIIVDGVETTNTWVGTPGQGVVTDFIDELQVKSSGYSAEFGGSTGAVLNAVTKSGGSRWQGLGVIYWSGSALDAAPRATLRLRPRRCLACRVRHLSRRSLHADRARVHARGAAGGRPPLAVQWLPAFVQAARTDGHVPRQPVDPHVHPGSYPPEWPRQRDGAPEPAMACQGLVCDRAGETAHRAARAGWHQRSERQLRRRRRDPQLLDLRQRRLHADRVGVSEHPRRLLRPRLVQRGCVSGGSLRLPDAVLRVARRAATIPTTARVHERAVEHRPGSRQGAAPWDSG